jgi:fatty-acid desaturase
MSTTDAHGTDILDTTAATPQLNPPGTEPRLSEADSSPAAKPSDDRWAPGLAWWTVGWIGFLHFSALAAPFCFTWQGLIVAVVLFWLTASLGICLGYHRLLTHASYQTYPLIRRLLAVLGTLAGEGSPLFWVAAHRKHHRFSDQEGDPHSPRDGAWWSHIFWLFPCREALWQETVDRYAKDLKRDPFMRFLDATFIFWHLALGITLFAVGWIGWDLATGVSMVVYGMFLRLVCVLHITWLVNSAAHIWGYRNYETKDDSRNLWWVGLLASGEGWHNNHHAFPGRARHGHRWWEFDLTYCTIRLMERTGLAWKVLHGRPKPQPNEEKTGNATLA